MYNQAKYKISESLQEKTSSDAKDDNMRQGLVVLLGTLARYIPNREKIESIAFRLVGTLSTPSQPVTYSILSKIVESSKFSLQTFLPNNFDFFRFQSTNGESESKSET